MKNLSISKKVILGFIINLMFTIVVGLVGIVAISTISQEADNLSTYDITSILSLEQIRDNIQNQRINLQNVILMDAISDEYTAAIENRGIYEMQIEERILNYGNTIIISDERELYEQFLTSYKRFQTVQDKVYELVSASEIENAKTILIASTPDTSETLNILNQILDLKESYIDSMGMNIFQLSNIMKILLCTILVSCIIFIAFISTYMFKTLKKQLET